MTYFFFYKKYYELVDQRALQFSQVAFENPHKISYTKTENCDIYTMLQMWEFSDLKDDKQFWNAPQIYVLILWPLNWLENYCTIS